MHFVTMSQFYDPRFVPLTWEGSRTFFCVFISLCPTTNLAGVFLEKMISKTALQNRIYGKLAQLSQRKLLSGLCCHLLLSILLFWLEWCAFRTSLAAIYLQKYWAFSKKYSVISFSITAVRFWFKFLTEYTGGWNNHTVCLCSSGRKSLWCVVSPVWVGANQLDKRQRAETGAQEATPACEEELPYCEGDWTQEQVAMRSYGVSFPGDIQNPSVHKPEQHALEDQAWARRLD